MCPLTRKVYQFARCPMGHRNSAVVFQKLIDRVLQSLPIENLGVYIDDIISSHDTEQELLTCVEKLFDLLAKHNLKIALQKCIFFTKELTCFGYKISKKGLKPDESRIEKLLKIPIPETKKELLSYLASLNFYRAHIPGFAGTASKLYRLTSKNAEFKLSDQDVKDFNSLKTGLANSILLNKIDETKDFVLETDASVTGIGSVLKQIYGPQDERIIAVDSSTLKGAERLWEIAALELKACYTGLLKNEKIIGNKHVTLRVDNKSLYYLLKSKLAEVEISKRTPACRMLLYISTYFYSVEHKKGTDYTFKLCDLLSRMHNTGKLALAVNSKKPLVSHMKETVDTIVSVPVLTIDAPEKIIPPNIQPETIHEQIKLAQMESKQCLKIRNCPPKKFLIEGDIVYKLTNNGKFIYCPPFFSSKVLSELHRHESARNLVQKVNDYNIWIPDKYKLIAAFVSNCNICDPSRSKKLMEYQNHTISKPTLPFMVTCIDISGFGTDSNFLVYVCALTKFVYAKVLRNMTSASVKTILLEVFTIFGRPQVILSDNASNFTSAEIENFFNTFGILHRRSSPMNSRGNALSEATIKRIQNRTRVYQPTLEELCPYLSIICFELNTQKVDGEKLSSFQKLFHRDAT